MAFGRVFASFRRNRTCGALIGLSVAAASGWMYVTAPVQPVVFHLFYLFILAGAFCYGAPGGAAVGVIAALLGRLVPSVDAAPAGWDAWLGALSYVIVGAATGALVDSLHRRQSELHRLTDDAIHAFVRALHAIDGPTARHSEKVATYAETIARHMKLPPDQIDRVRWAALLHDVGKLTVPPEILNKEGPLNDDEWAVIRRHPVESVRIVHDIAQLRGLLAAVRHHHERMDGRGYPDGIDGVHLPLEARIIAVADAFDAMTSDRPYRPALSVHEAWAELRRHAGSQFDPAVVAAFIAAHEQLGGPTDGSPHRHPQKSMEDPRRSRGFDGVVLGM